MRRRAATLEMPKTVAIKQLPNVGVSMSQDTVSLRAEKAAKVLAVDSLKLQQVLADEGIGLWPGLMV